MRIRVLLVDDHQIFREALRGLLEKMTDLEVIGETGEAVEAIRLVDELTPDIVCMDIGLPGTNGIEITRQIKRANPRVKVIALSTHCEHAYVIDMMKAGASAYVAKAEGGNELIRAIGAVLQNQQYLSSSIADLVTRTLFIQKEHPSTPLLGDRERQVLHLVAKGMSSLQIASSLKITPGTVDVHRRNIMRKLDIHSAVELTRYAIKSGLIEV